MHNIWVGQKFTCVFSWSLLSRERGGGEGGGKGGKGRGRRKVEKEEERERGDEMGEWSKVVGAERKES